MFDAQIFADFLRAAHAELTEPMIQIPRQELQLMRLGMQIYQKILILHQDTVHRTDPGRDRHETCKLVQIQIIFHLFRESLIIRVGYQFEEIDQMRAVLRHHCHLRIIQSCVVIPVVADILHQAAGHRFEHDTFLRAKVIPCERSIQILHDRIKPHISIVMQSGDCQIDLRERIPRRGHSRVTEQPVRQDLIHIAGIGHAAVQIQLGRSAQSPSLDLIVQVYLHGTLQIILGLHISTVALVTDIDFIHRDAVKLHIRRDPVENDTGHTGHAIAGTLYTSQERSSAAGTSSGASVISTGTSAHRGGRDIIETADKIRFLQSAGLIGIPFRKPLIRDVLNFIQSQLLILIRICRKQSPCQHHTDAHIFLIKTTRTARSAAAIAVSAVPVITARTAGRTSARSAKAAADSVRLHRFPFFFCKNKMDFVDLVRIEQLIP